MRIYINSWLQLFGNLLSTSKSTSPTAHARLKIIFTGCEVPPKNKAWNKRCFWNVEIFWTSKKLKPSCWTTSNLTNPLLAGSTYFAFLVASLSTFYPHPPIGRSSDRRSSDGCRMVVGRANGRSGPTAVPFFPSSGSGPLGGGSPPAKNGSLRALKKKVCFARR